MSDLYEWCEAYAAALPPTIRPGLDDHRFIAAAGRARGNGWTPTQAAHVIAGRSYATAMNPHLIALIRLEEIAGRPPHTPAQVARHSSGCLVCAPGTTCPDPVNERHRIPARWLAERMALIRELQHTRDMTEDEREQAMAILIDHQEARA